MTPAQKQALAIASAKVRLEEQRAADEEAAARAAEPKVTFGQEAPGVANTAVERGLIGIQGIPGTIAESGMQLGGWLDRTFLGGTTTSEQIHERNPVKDYLPTAGDYIADYEKRQAEAGAAPPVEPQTTGGKFLAKGLQGAAGGIVGGPWGVLTGGLSGVGSEAGRKLAEDTAWEGPAEVFGGLVGGMSPTGVGRAITPRNIREINAAHAATLRAAGVRHLTEGQVSGSKITQARERGRMGLGGEGRGVEQLEDHTAHLLKQAGINERLATRPVVKEAFKREGQVVKDVAGRNNLTVDEQAYQHLVDGVDEYFDMVPEAARAPFIARFRTEMEELYTRPGGGTMSGEKYQAYRSRLGRLAAKTEDNQLRGAFRDMQEALDEAMDRSVRPEDAGVWKAFRERYRNLLVVEHAIGTHSSEANLGLITPAALQNAMYQIYGKRAMVTGREAPGDLTNFSTASQAIMNPLPFTGYAPANTGGIFSAGWASPLKWAFQDLPNAVRMTAPMQQYLTNRMIPRQPNATMLPPAPGVAAVTSALVPQLSAPPRQLPPPVDAITRALIPQ